jgi:Pyruvate/2-oxoacid:ferredoxin oxidoreductase delta subunit
MTRSPGASTGTRAAAGDESEYRLTMDFDASCSRKNFFKTLARQAARTAGELAQGAAGAIRDAAAGPSGPAAAPALRIPEPGTGIVSVRELDCLSVQGRRCDYCQTHCPETPKAIVVSVAGVAPRVDEAACTGCGQCVDVCPTACLSVGGD